MALTRVDKYLKNLARSTVFTVADVTKSDLMPDTMEFIQANKQVLTTTYSLLKNPSATFKKTVGAIQESKVYKALDYGVKNTLEDLRTGNFYNVERKDRDEARLAGMDASNMGDLSEFGVDDDWEKNLGKSDKSKPEKSNVVTSGDEAVVSAVEGSIAASTSANVNAIIGSTDVIVKNSRANTAMIYAQNEKLFGALHKDMMGIGTMMNDIGKIQAAAMQNIDKNSSQYYTQSIKLDTERNAILKEMLEMQRKMYESSAAKEKAEREKNNSKKRMRWNDIQYNGMPDLGNYAKLVGSNIKNITGMLNLPGMDGDSNMLASMMVSPLQYMMEFAVKGIIPATIKEATKELNDTIAGMFGLTMSRMNNARRNGTGGIWEMLSKVFGVNLEPNRSIDTSKYERGPIPFDGITRKAVIDVIPTYLRRIEAHLTGKRERAYDYDSGRWVTGEEVKKELERVKERYEKSGTSEFMRDFSKQSKKIAFTNESDSNKFFKAQRELEKYLFEVGGDINIDVGPAGNGVSPTKYPNLSDPNVWKMITSTIRSMYTFTGANGKSNFKSSKIMGLAKNVNEAKANEDRFYRSLEEGTSAIKSFLSSGLSGIDKHGSTDKNGNFNAKSPYMTFKDEHGNSLFNYLQNINKELSFIRINGIRDWGDGSYKNNSKFVPFDRIDIKNPNWSNPNTNNNKSIEQKEAEKAYKNALENAKRGKAIAFTDLDRLDAKQLANLMGAIRDSATNEHNAELRSMVDSNAISSYLDKRFGVDKTSLEEVNRRRKAGNKAADEDEYAGLETNDPAEKNFVQKIMEKINKTGSLTRAISSTGTEIFRDMLYSADAAIYHMFFKSDLSSDDKNKKKFKGFMDFMADKINTTFEKVSNYFKDHVLDPLKEKLGINEDSKQRFKDTFSGMAKGLGRMYVQANKDVFGESYKYFTGEEFGSKKTKYGLTPDPTPKPIANKNLINEIYDTKQPTKTPVTKGKQVGGTAAPILDLDSLGGLAKGTMGRPFMGKSMLSKGELIFNSRGVSMINKTGAYSVNEPSHILNSEDSHTLLTGMGINAGPKHSIASSLAKEKAEKNRLFGTNGKGIAHHADGTNVKIDGTDITLGELLSTAKKYAPETAAGGAMGGLLGLLVGGPLIGAAIGGASMLIKNSDSLKKKLFGDEKQEGGLVPAKIQQSVMKYFPSMAKYGMAGILPGLITPFGPLGGLLLGGAFGFLKQNEDFKERYFGENGKLKITKKEQDILKKMFPAAGKGAIAGLVGSVIVGGPFGLLGSAALGAGLGMMGATDEFKNMLLGIEVDGVRSGGIVGAFKETISPLTDAFRNLGKSLLNTFDKNIIDPLSRFIRPAIHAIPQVLGIIPRKINDWVKDKVFKTGKTVMEKWFGKDSIAGKAARGAIGLAGLPFKAMTAPFRALGGIGDAIRMKQINTMNASYMTAEERMEFMKSKNKKVSKLDEMMAGANKDTLKELRENLTYRTDNVNAIQKKAKSSGSEILRMLDGFQGTSGGKISAKARDKISKALNSENSEKAIMNILAKEGLTKEEFNQLMHGDNDLAGKLTNYNDLYSRKLRAQNRSDTGMSEADAKVQEILRKSGIKNFDINNTHDVEKLIANLTTEIEHKDAMSDEENEANEKAWDLDVARNTKLDNLVAATKMQVQLLGALNGLSSKDIENKLKDNINKISSGQEPDMDINNLRALAQTADARNATEANINKAEGVINYAKDQQADYLMGKYVDPTGASEEELKNLRDAATRPSEGRKLSNLYRGGGANKLFKMAAKHRLSIEQMSVLGESVGTFISFIKGCNLSAKWFDASAAKHIVSLDPVDRKSLMTLISLNGFRMWVIARKTPLTDKDLQSISLRTANAKNDRNEFNSRFETASNNVKKFNTIESVINMSTADWVNGGKTNIFNSDASNVTPVDGGETTETGENVASNGLGTMLLGGAKALLSGGAKLVGGLFKGGAKLTGKALRGADRFVGNRVNSLLNGGEIVDNGYAAGQTPMNLDETDKAGDGRDVVPTSEGMALIKRGTDGSVDYDTTDSGTKSVLQKLGLKKKFAEKLHAAQLRASELTTKVFGETEEEKRKSKLGMLGLILGGTFLAKTGIFKKLFEGVIKPLWDDHLKPFIFDKALPWIGETLPKLISGAVSMITEHIPAIIQGAVTAIITNFPTLLKAFGVGIADGVNNLLKKTTNNDHGEGTSTTTSKDNLKQAYDKDGNLLTGDDLKNATELYNEQGAKGEIDENGNITFKDESNRHATLIHTVGDASFRALLKGGLPGVELASKALNFVGKHGGPTGKVLKVAGKAILAPIKAAGNIGRGAMNMFVERGMVKAAGGKNPRLITDILNRAGGAKLGQGIDKAKGATANIISNVASKASKIKDAAKIAIDSGKYLAANPELAGAATKTEKVISKVVGVGNKIANSAIGQNTASAVTKVVDGAKGLGGKIATIISNIGTAINKAFSNGPILSKFKSVLNVFGKLGDKVTKVLLSIKEKLFTFFSKVITTNAPKVSAEVIKKAADKAFFVIAIMQGVADFTTGCDQAEAILGVSETNIFEEFMCGIVKLLSGISLILTIVPGVPTIARGCLNFILGLMGKEGDLEARQKEADAEWEKYKQETGSTESKDEYLKYNKSVSGKLGKAVGKAWDSTKKVVGGAIDGVKNVASGAWEGIKTGASAVGNFVGGAANKVGEVIGGAVDGLGKAGSDLLDGIGQVGKFIVKGDIGGLMGFNTGIKGTETYEGNLARPVVGAIKTVSFLPTVASAGAHKLGGLIGDAVNGIKKIGGAAIDTFKDLGKLTFDGKVDDLFAYRSPAESEGGIAADVSMVAGMVGKFIAAPFALVSAGIHGVFDFVGDTFTSAADIITKTDTLVDKAINGDVSIFSSDYWDSGINGDGFGATVGKGFSYFTKIISLPRIMISQVFNGLGDFFNGIVDWVGGFFDGVKDFFSDPLGFIYKKFTEASPEPGEVQQQSQNVADGLHGGYGTSRSKFGRGYSKQNDPSIANIGFNSRGDSSRQTIGDSACGPTAAVNVMESMYGRGGNEVLKAANYALKGGYKERDGGTRPEFFTNYFRANGLDSEMSTNRFQLAANINSGMPTVLMGSDANGTSGRTPYGRNPHYVTVTGTDGRGNAIVQDPEAKKDNQLYNMNTLLSKSNLGISAYGRGSRIPFHRILPTHAFGKYGLGKWGRGEATVGGDGLLTGRVINIPAGLGSYFVIEGWHTITSTQGTWQGRLKMKCENYDQEGFAKIGDRYVIACTTVYGVVGDYVDFYQSNGNVFKCIIGDIKSAGDANIGVYGHDYGKNVLEFICNRSWYGPPMHANPGTKTFHPEWGGQTMVKAVNGGSFFTAAENLEQRKFLYKRYGGKYPGIGPNGEWTKVDGDTTSSGTVTNMGGVSGGVDGVSTSGDSSSQQQEPQGILNIFSNVLDNSLAGKALAAFTGGVSGSNNTSSSSSSFSNGGDNFSGTAGRYEGDATGDPKKLLEVAASQVGNKEDHSRNDSAGRGWTKYGQWFGMPNEEWCAMFVSWVADQAGISQKVIPKHAYTPAGADKFPSLGAQLVSPQNASPGDIVYFWYPGKGRISHIGIVEKGGDAVHTIEGNTGANIDEVKRQTYQFSDKSLNKIFRPNYEFPNGSTNNIASNNAIASPTTTSSTNKTSGVTISATGTWGSGLKPASNLGTFKAGPVKTVRTNINSDAARLEREYKSSGLKNGDIVTYNGRKIAASGTSSPKYGMGDANLSSNIIVQLLYKIADNTDKLGMILDILSDKLNLKIDSKDVHKHTSPVNLKRKIRDALNNRSGIKDSNDSRSIEDMITSMRLVASQ